VVKIYRDRKPPARITALRNHLGGKLHRFHFNDLEKAIIEAEAKSAQVCRSVT